MASLDDFVGDNYSEDLVSKRAPDGKTVAWFHREADVDQGEFSMHHTLGQGAYQASPGNHNHDGKNSPFLSPNAFGPGGAGGGGGDILQRISNLEKLDDDFRLGGSLGSSTDLDDVLNTGRYHQSTNANATLAKHYPLEGVAGVLIVERADTSGGTPFRVQRYHTRPVPTRVFTRSKFSTNAWSAWVELTPTAGPRTVIPSSVVVGSGSATVDTFGVVTFSGASSVSLLNVFDGTGVDAYEVYAYIARSNIGGVATRLRTAGGDVSSGYAYSGIETRLSSGPSRASNSGFDRFGFWQPAGSPPAAPVTSGRMAIFGPAISGRRTHILLHSSSLASDVYHWIEAGDITANTFTGLTIFPAAGAANPTISGTVKVVKIA